MALRRRVNKSFPCPICGKDTWCLVAKDGTDAICPRTWSAKEIKGRDGQFVGYYHKLDGSVSVPPPPPKPQKQRQIDNFSVYASECHKRFDMPELLAKSLGVGTKSLVRLEVGIDGATYTFPMRDGEGNIIGIHLRSPMGRKWAVPGSKNGLFIPHGVYQGSTERLYIVEGPTDCAALLDLGLNAIGRAACMGQESMVNQFLRRRREVVIIADNDESHQRPDGSWFNPGMDGARRLADAILPRCLRLCIIQPVGCKDVREWRKKGLTAAILDAIIQSKCWRQASVT